MDEIIGILGVNRTHSYNFRRVVFFQLNYQDMLKIETCPRFIQLYINRYMKQMLFVYRVVFKKGYGYYVYKLHEENNKFYFVSTFPSTVFAPNIQELEDKLKIYSDALKLPVINFEDIKIYTLDNIDPIVYPPQIDSRF